MRDGRSPLVLTERNDHLDILAARLSTRVQHLVVLRGGMSRKALKSATDTIATIPCEEERIILATGRYIGEGFDDARLDTLFLTLPISWHGTVAQYVGRLHRLYDGKREVQVYDYADLNVTMLSRMFDRRCNGYEAVGYTIQLPGSAVPGWPADVPLPVDPEWKTQYAASVRRLIRDGADPPLANLFVHVAKTPDTSAQGIECAEPPPRHSYTAASKHCRRLQADSGSTSNYQFHSMAGDEWRWTCFARQRISPLNWMEASILKTSTPIGATDEKTCCCRKTATLFFDSFAKMWASASTMFLTQSCEPYRIDKHSTRRKRIL